MSDPLVTYVEDHLAGARYAIDLLEALCDQHAGEPLSRFAKTMLVQVKADAQVLEQLAAHLGSTGGLKQISAWLMEKVGRLKLRRGASDGLGTFEALEFLALGILGKLSLWRALALLVPSEKRLRNIDFETLIERAERQHAQVEKRRLEATRAAFNVSRASRINAVL